MSANNDQQQEPNGNRMDRFERGLERLLKVQASHDARIDRLFAGHSDHAARHQMAENRLERIEISIDNLVSIQRRHEQELDGLMEIVQRSSAATGDKLNALIQVVDDIVRRRPPEPPAS